MRWTWRTYLVAVIGAVVGFTIGQALFWLVVKPLVFGGAS